MYLTTKRVKPQKLSLTAQRAIEDRDYFMKACVELQAEVRRLRCERDEAQRSQRAAEKVSVPKDERW